MTSTCLTADLRFGIRRLRRSPGFAAAAILTLALGIGASTTLFTVVYGVLFKPLPYRDADRLVLLHAEQDFSGARQPVRAHFPFEALHAWPRDSDAFESVAFYAEEVATLSSAEGSEVVTTATVSDAFFPTIGGHIALGRPMAPPDDQLPVAVVSQRLWLRLYGGDPAAIGQRLILSRRPLTIVGIADADFQFPSPQIDVWIPAGFMRAQNSKCCGFLPIARLKPAVSMERATEQAAAVVRSLEADMPRYLAGARVRAIGFHDHVTGPVRSALLLLAAAVGLVLMLACANVMNLLLAQNVARSREVALRRALGASRGRLILHSLIDSAILVITASALGTALSMAAVSVLKRRPPLGFPRLDAVAVDGTVILFACAVAALTTLAIGVLPALGAGDTGGALRVGRASDARHPGARLMLRGVTVGQLAISVVLLVAAVLLGRSLVELMRTDLGVSPDHVATASVNLSMDRAMPGQQQIELIDRILARVRALPGVTAAGVGTARPPDKSRMRLTLRSDPDTGRSLPFLAAAVPVTPEYFRALGVRLQAGRFFTAADVETTAPVIILSGNTARLLFGEQDPIGRTIQLPVLRDGATSGREMTVVGITAEVKYSGLDRLPDAIVYRPFAQQPWPAVFLVVRTAGDPEVVASVLRREIAAVDPAIAVTDVSTLEAIVAELAAQPRFRALWLAAFACLAIAIAAVGLYGVMAYSVSQRTNEIGIRMALGAGRRNILATVVGEGLLLSILGTVLGWVGAYAMTRLMTALLFQVQPTDVLSFGLAAAALMAVGVAASYLPARRAVSVDPITTLRTE